MTLNLLFNRIIPPRSLQPAIQQPPNVSRLFVTRQLGLRQLLRHPIALARNLPEPHGKFAVSEVVDLSQELVELTREMLALLQSRTGLLVGGDVDGIGLDDDLSGLCDCFFGSFGGEESFDLLQSDHSGVDFGLRNAAVGLVEEDDLVVRRVDVAEDAAGGCGTMLHAADGNDNWSAVSIALFAAMWDAAEVAGS
jgi:hypothetical protein